jgi:prefoldin subunit 5
MTFLNGAEPAGERRAADDGQSGQSGSDDVTITIRGLTAAKMLGRGDAEKRIIEELSQLSQRLDGMEAAATQRATRHQALSQLVQGLQEKVAQLSGHLADQVRELRTELSRLRTDVSDQASKAAHLPGRIDQVQGQVDLLQRRVGPLQMQLDGLERAIAPPSATDAASSGQKPGWLDKWRQPDRSPTNGEASASNGWLKQRLNFLGLW